MSVWNGTGAGAPESRSPQGNAAGRVTVPGLAERKRHGQKIAAVTAYDAGAGRMADEAGVDLILVGDSAGMVVLGYDTTLPVTLDEMLLFTRAVRRGVHRALLVADLPFGTYEADPHDAVRSGIRLVKESGAEAVKLEGGRERSEAIRRLVDAEVPVMGHLGLTPQAVHRMGGFRVQARTAEAIERLHEDAHLLVDAGVFSLVLEGIPREVAAELTAQLPVPTIGIGAGPECDGQILVWHDLLGLSAAPASKFVRRFAEAGEAIRAGLAAYTAEVREGSFPADNESYHLPRASAERTGSGLVLR